MVNDMKSNGGPTIYIASKTRHARRWKALREQGVNIISTWIDEAGAGETIDEADLAQRCIRESVDADLFILYAEPEDVLKGGLVEFGARLGAGREVISVGQCISTASVFAEHPLWREVATIDEVLAAPPRPADEARSTPQPASGYNAGVKCDMTDGPCACGAWHTPEQQRRQPDAAGVDEKLDEPALTCASELFAFLAVDVSQEHIRETAVSIIRRHMKAFVESGQVTDCPAQKETS
jgi:hypothetical protein